jgi:hypothetical protein
MLFCMWDDVGDHGGIDTAEICLNGHVTNDHATSHPEVNRKFCEECGAQTVQQCPRCGYNIFGSPVNAYGGFAAPTFCGACGKPFPWTETRIKAAKAMADELQELSEADRIMLKSSIDDIAANTPMTEVAVVRVKKLISKLAKDSADALRRLVVDVASEAAKKMMTGGS